ncbi:MAG: acyl-CoA thioesterase [Bacteroidales bacterium]|nr:acyl-CoA thioesterase [Bacteroidales bacterium]MDE6801529.1 acyl-CoA thioesterase [Muribaculaceae bacterium]
MKPEDYTFSTEIKVRDYEVDVQGIVNNARYLHYLEHTRHEFCEMVGYTFRQMHLDGCDPVLKRAEIDYLTPLGLGDTMISCLDIVRKGARYIFRQDIYKPDGTPVVRARTTIVIIRDGRPTRGDELAEAFGPYLKADV